MTAERGPKRLLLVDDEPRNLALLKKHLGGLGYDLVRATDGRAALSEFERRRPDSVLVDLVMPGFDGLDVLAHIRADTASTHTPVILVTAHTDREHRLRGLRAGADEFLEKPVDAPILLARVRTLLQLKESRDALADRNEALERMRREQRELTAFIVHDLKNPLSVLWSNVEWARQNAPGGHPELVEVLDDAYGATRRLSSMIDDLLVVSRLEESAFPARAEPVRVADLVAEAVQHYGRLAAAKGVSLSSAATESLHVLGDRALLRRVLENILDNSLRYTPQAGRVAVSANRCGDVEIRVSNSGPPVPAGERERIFEKFVRGSGQQSGGGNAGLGLYFCRQALRALGGAIEVVQTEEWPTSFVLHLPAAEPSSVRAS